MHQGRGKSASSSYLQGAIRRGQTRISQHTVRTSTPYLPSNVKYCRRRLRVCCYIELSEVHERESAWSCNLLFFGGCCSSKCLMYLIMLFHS